MNKDSHLLLKLIKDIMNEVGKDEQCSLDLTKMTVQTTGALLHPLTDDSVTNLQSVYASSPNFGIHKPSFSDLV